MAARNENKFEIDFLTDADDIYVTDTRLDYGTIDKINLNEVAFFRVDEVTFDEQAPRKEALENVISAMRIPGIHFLYLILGSVEGVKFYYGISKDYEVPLDDDLNIYDIGKYILLPSITGNFRGSKVTAIDDKEEQDTIIQTLSGMKYASVLEGVPGSNENDEKFQCADRLVDSMAGETFALLIVAKPLDYERINQIEENLYGLYSSIAPFLKQSIQTGTTSSTGRNITDSTSSTEGWNKSFSKTQNESESEGNTETTGYSTSNSRGKTTSKGHSSNSSSSSTSESGGTSTQDTSGKSRSDATTRNRTVSGGTSESDAKSGSTNKGRSEGTNTSEGTSESKTREYVNRKIQEWIKYLDDIIIPRLDYGNGKGTFIISSCLFSNTKAGLKKLENTTISLYSGETGNKMPLRAFEVGKNREARKFLENFQVPVGIRRKALSHEEVKSRAALSQVVTADNTGLYVGNWVTAKELSMIAGLPQKEVVGLSLNEEVEFGLNIRESIKDENKIYLGNLVQSGNILRSQKVYLDRKNLDKHIFITGVTGSGKTTTCHSILASSELPFLIIEPAKTEYRILKEPYKDLLVFSLGKDFVTPFRLNPFEFFPHESVTSRVDMIMAAIESSFDMEAAIPQIIEKAIYECYEDYGWDIASNKNRKFCETAFDDGVYAFPTLGDLVEKIESVVNKQGFDDRLKNDYLGSIRARLQGLLVGSKGLMLNTRRSIDFRDLLKHHVVLELEEIRSGSEKSLIMAFILTNLMEAIKSMYLQEHVPFRHITLVEEAHRLLSKYEPGDSPNKKQGVEVFTDMLAEIRKYGESLVIVDQIPNKLTPEVLKNTNTKIVHKIFAQDDKEAIGNTIALTDEQKEFLSNLDTGRAIVFTQGYRKAVQVQIAQTTHTDGKQVYTDGELRRAVLEYYASHYTKGLIFGSDLFETQPTAEALEDIMQLKASSEAALILLRDVGEFADRTASACIAEYSRKYGIDFTTSVLYKILYRKAEAHAEKVEQSVMALQKLASACCQPELLSKAELERLSDQLYTE